VLNRDLEPEQADLLKAMVEASRNVDVTSEASSTS
jgi:hypothetical protein